MRLPSIRTQSQKQLASKLGVYPNGGGSLTWQRMHPIFHAAKTALAAALCWWLALRFGLHDGYWGAISATIVLQSNFGATIAASRDRILGTIIGALVGFAFSLVGSLPWNYVLAMFLAIAICGLFGLRSSSRLAGVTITIVMLVQSSSHKSIALDRVLQVLLGILVAIAVTTLVFPDRARIALRDGLAQEFLVLGAFFEAILQGFRGETSPHLSQLRTDALDSLRQNNQLLEASRNEPSGGPGWREGLGMLSQFGRSLYDSLVALDLAVQDSANDSYAQHLEPELGKLAFDILGGFHYVAECVHTWRFHVSPPNLHLEQDITDLEARLTELRPAGIAYSQSEILRAYAVQLHLKHIARLLRASRTETSRAVGEPQSA